MSRWRSGALSESLSLCYVTLYYVSCILFSALCIILPLFALLSIVTLYSRSLFYDALYIPPIHRRWLHIRYYLILILIDFVE
jgi:hypothetical protein